MTKPNPSGILQSKFRGTGVRVALVLLLFFVAFLIVVWKGGETPIDHRRAEPILVPDQSDEFIGTWNYAAEIRIPTEQPADCTSMAVGALWYQEGRLTLCSSTDYGYEYVEVVEGDPIQVDIE